MKKIAYFAGGIAVAASMATIATSLTVPNSFTSGTPISSTEMNANFDAVKAAVDDNDTRITALESGNANCPADMVAVNSICVDKYEATVKNVADGSYVPDMAAAALCNANGSDCKDKIIAESVEAQLPTINITWFQAQQACAAAGKRLLTNAEWQLAATGTDIANCNSDGTVGVANTDANPNCISSYGVINMAGNVNEWVADWAINSGGFGEADDPATTIKAIYRGGGQGGGTMFTANAATVPSFIGIAHGFRCAK